MLSDHTTYRRLVGSLLYLTVTRPDLASLVQVLSQFMEKPTQSYMTVTQRVLRYLKLTPGQVLLLSASSGRCLKAFIRHHVWILEA